MVVHIFNLSTREAEAGGSLNSRPAWTTEQVPGQPGTHREALSTKTKQNKNRSWGWRDGLVVKAYCSAEDPSLTLSTHVKWLTTAYNLLQGNMPLASPSICTCSHARAHTHTIKINL